MFIAFDSVLNSSLHVVVITGIKINIFCLLFTKLQYLKLQVCAYDLHVHVVGEFCKVIPFLVLEIP